MMPNFESLWTRARSLDFEVLRFTACFTAGALAVLATVGAVSLAAGVWADHVFVLRERQADFAAKAELRKAEDEELSTWGWADREAGFVRIPIEKAMALEAQAARGEGR